VSETARGFKCYSTYEDLSRNPEQTMLSRPRSSQMPLWPLL
jgi:hypothetical protein